jgi:hypothetical protein
MMPVVYIHNNMCLLPRATLHSDSEHLGRPAETVKRDQIFCLRCFLSYCRVIFAKFQRNKSFFLQFRFGEINVCFTISFRRNVSFQGEPIACSLGPDQVLTSAITGSGGAGAGPAV